MIDTGVPLCVSAAGAAQANNCALPAAVGAYTHIQGFVVSGAGATGASVVDITITGLLGGTMTFKLAIPAGATTGFAPLVVNFPRPLPASASNTAITLNVPSFGAGNLHAAATAFGFQS